jgi:hypothetical protein
MKWKISNPFKRNKSLQVPSFGIGDLLSGLVGSPHVDHGLYAVVEDGKGERKNVPAFYLRMGLSGGAVIANPRNGWKVVGYRCVCSPTAELTVIPDGLTQNLTVGKRTSPFDLPPINPEKVN